MILPKIEYENSLSTVFDGDNVIAITLRDSSVGSDIDVWSVIVNSGTVTYSEPNNELITVFAVISTPFDVVVTLTLLSGHIATMRLVGDGTNIAYVGLDVDVFILPENNVQFDTQEYTASIVGTYPGISYTSFEFDATNDAIADDTSVIGAVFSHTYTSNSTAELTGITTEGNVYTTIGVEILDVDNLRELIVDSVDECTKLEVWSQTVNYIEKLIGRGNVDNSEMEYLSVEIVQNCCESGKKEFNLAPIYDFSVTAANDCTEDELSPIVYDGDTYELWNITISINGIDPSIISQLRYAGGHDNFPFTINTNTPINEFNLQYLMPDGYVPPLVVEEYTVEITTTAGFVYLIEFTFTPDFLIPPGGCGNTIEINNITYPENPCYVEIVEDVDRTYLSIDSQLYYGCNDSELDELEAMSDGVYQVTIGDSGLSNEYITGCEFVDCETYCLVLQALANECDPIVVILYDALKNATECDNISCQNYCDLYEMLLAKLEECDCLVYANKPVKTVKKPCNCK